MTDAPDYRSTVFLPRTAFPMKAGLAEAEPRTLARWQADDLHGQLRAARAGRPRFILHDGPPYANGDPHIGHALNKILKDLVVRTQSLLGRDAPYIPGWDCHGLPIEWKVEEQYRAKKRSKDEVPPPEFRAECRAFAAKWVAVQRAAFERWGVLGDWDHPYLTMDYAAEAAIVAELLKFAATGQVYRGAKPVMWSPVERTALAEAEVEYEDITSTQIDVAFEITHAPNASELVGAHAVVWTTTPWTIPVNQAIAYGETTRYVWFKVVAAMRDGVEQSFAANHIGKHFIVAEQLLDEWQNRTCLVAGGGDYRRAFDGAALAGATARHPMHHLGGFFARPRPFLPGEFVTTDQGTGLVHMAPDHGEDDFALCKANNIDPVFAVEPDGRYRADWPWLPGQGSVIAPKLNAPDGPICADLHQAGALLAASADYKHSYPHSWRSKAKLIFRATPQWFIAMDQPLATGATLRDTALTAIDATRFVPERGRARLRAMVADRPDWLISRQRAWGVPITLFVDKATGEILRDPQVDARIIASVAHAGADAWFAADPAHLLGPGRDPAQYEQITDILDVWFDSGSTHAFVTEARLNAPQADLYLEGSDQHRGWFQSSLLESCGTRGQAPYKAVLTHGFTQDAQGRKMSKSVGNTVDPATIVNTAGADVLRLWVASTDFVDDQRIGKEILSGVTESYRKLRNTLRYLLGALDGWSEDERVAPADMPELERWVLHRLAELDTELRTCVDDFDFTRYVTALRTFCDTDLSAFYFDVRKDSLYCDPPTSPKRRACRTVMHTLFETLVRWLAPILVFTAEEAWTARYPERKSVHLETWPETVPGSELMFTDTDILFKYSTLRGLKSFVTEAVERLRRDKTVGSSLEAVAHLTLRAADDVSRAQSIDFTELCIVSEATVSGTGDRNADVIGVTVGRTAHPKCHRCWRHRPEVGTLPDPNLCERCHDVVGTSVIDRAAA